MLNLIKIYVLMHQSMGTAAVLRWTKTISGNRNPIPIEPMWQIVM